MRIPADNDHARYHCGGNDGAIKGVAMTCSFPSHIILEILKRRIKVLAHPDLPCEFAIAPLGTLLRPRIRRFRFGLPALYTLSNIVVFLPQ